jgi:hypothetical protein
VATAPKFGSYSDSGVVLVGSKGIIAWVQFCPADDFLADDFRFVKL